MENNSRYIVAGVGFIWGIVEPTVSLIAICLAMVLIDCFTAWRLNMRVAKAYKDKAKSPEFKSKHAMKMFGQLLVIFALIIVAYWIDTKIGMLGDIRLANAIAGLFVAVELLS
ncbi:MAG: phage holin family protein, partial [Muribaculaceae bacterium]